jgi:hypothetical protein
MDNNDSYLWSLCSSRRAIREHEEKLEKLGESDSVMKEKLLKEIELEKLIIEWSIERFRKFLRSEDEKLSNKEKFERLMIKKNN